MQLLRRTQVLRNGLLLTLALIGLGEPRSAHSAGVTIITHGFNGNAQGWVLGMASHIPNYEHFPGTNVICYEVSVSDNNGFTTSSRKLAGGNPLNDLNTEIVIKLDWADLAGFFNQYDTCETAAAVVPHLLRSDFIADLNGHALVELPLHLIGHSRGGSLVCEISRLLGENGVWVDQVTTLDPHPVNADGNIDPLTVSDAPLRVYDNVLFADNYYQDFDGYPHGQPMPNSYNRQLTTLPGGYSSAHSDLHLWYHATIDLFDPADDTEALLSASDRATWFTSYENRGLRAGFFYSRLGGGNRLSLDEPAGPGAGHPAEGYNQYWSLGGGISGNRTPLSANNGDWPSLIRLNLAKTNLMAHGQSSTLTLSYQWAQPTTSNATMRLCLDDDNNPWNGNEQILRELPVRGTTSASVLSRIVSFDVDATNGVPGVHSLYAMITSGERARYLYAPELLTVFSSFEPPHLSVSRELDSQVRVDVTGVPGQRIVLQSTADFQSWQPVATNWLTTDQWSYRESVASSEATFYRATLQ